MCHTLLVLRQIKFSTLQLREKREVIERLCIEEVGVDLELCVHVHRHDVDLNMEASLIIKCSLVISSSCICKLILCNRGSDHIFSLIPFPGQVKILVFCRSFHLSNLYYDLPRVLPPVISRISRDYITSYEFFLNYYFSPIPIFHGFWVISHLRTPVSESIPRYDSITLSNFRCL